MRSEIHEHLLTIAIMRARATELVCAMAIFFYLGFIFTGAI
jgi:hypothetical protein